MRLGISSYCFYKKMLSGEMTIFDAIDFAKSVGYEAMDFADFAPAELSDPVFAKQVHDKCMQTGIAPSCYAVTGDLVRPTDRSVAEETEHYRHQIDIAAILGCSKIRLDTTKFYPEDGSCHNYRDVADRIAPILRELSEYACAKGMMTLSENHYRFFQDSERMDYLITKINCDNHKLLIDIGNFLCADENPIQAVGRLAQYAGHVHVKDFLYLDGACISPFEIWGHPKQTANRPIHTVKGDDGTPFGGGWLKTRGNNFIRGTILGNGIVPVHQCLDMLKDIGYDGDFTLEFEGLEEPLDAIRLSYRYLKFFAVK